MKNPSGAVAALSNPVRSAGSKLHFWLGVNSKKRTVIAQGLLKKNR